MNLHKSNNLTVNHFLNHFLNGCLNGCDWWGQEVSEASRPANLNAMTLTNTTNDNVLVEILQNLHHANPLENDENRRNALRILIDRHSSKLYRIVVRMGATKETAEDILQEAFIKLWLHPEKFNLEKQHQFISWLTRLTMNLVIDFQRKMGRKAEILTDNFDRIATDNASTDNEDNRRYQLFICAFQALPAKQKQAMNLCFFEDYSNQQAADMMGLKLKALQSLIVRGKQNMKNYVNKEQHDDE